MEPATFGRKKTQQQQENTFETPLVWISPSLQHLIQSFCATNTTVRFGRKNIFALHPRAFTEQGTEENRPHDFEWSKEMEWDPSTTLYFTCLMEGGNEESPGSDLGEMGTDKTLQLILKPRRHRINGSPGDNPGLAGQRTKPEPVWTWRANFAGPLGQIVPLNNVIVTTAANVWKLAFRNVNSIL